MPQDGRKVLIVEDNDLNLKLFKDLLEAHGFLTVETRDGRLAVGMAKQEKPDLIIMDIQLPHMSGIEIIELLKADKKLKHIPIIAVTAFAMKGDEERILETGCEAYLPKPISIDSFLKAIKDYI